MASSSFEARRISRTSIITLDAPLSEVFPLFGPIREKEWAAGWDPQVIYSTTGLVEEHMVFKTLSHGHGEPDYVWIVSKYQPEQAFIEYMRIPMKVYTDSNRWWTAVPVDGGHLFQSMMISGAG